MTWYLRKNKKKRTVLPHTGTNILELWVISLFTKHGNGKISVIVIIQDCSLCLWDLHHCSFWIMSIAIAFTQGKAFIFALLSREGVNSDYVWCMWWELALTLRGIPGPLHLVKGLFVTNIRTFGLCIWTFFNSLNCLKSSIAYQEGCL